MRTVLQLFFGMVTCLLAAFVQHSYAQSVSNVHCIQVESGGGLSWNPERRIQPVLLGNTGSAIAGWGTQQWGNNTMRWQAKTQRLEFTGIDVDARNASQLAWSLERALSANVLTGMRASGFNGTSFERNLRNAEEWKVFDATQWDARWWLTLKNGLREGEIYVQREAWTYRSNGGLDRRGFAFGSTLNLPLLTKVRGKRGLPKVNQRRTHHLANLVFCVEHKETQFEGWALSEGPVTGGQWLRSDAVSASNAELSGYRLWAETKGELRMEFVKTHGFSGGISGAWVHRTDAVRRAYDANLIRTLGWLSGASAQWAGRLMWRRDWAVHPELNVATESGWEGYRFVHDAVQFRAERGLKKGVSIFTQGEAHLWHSNASDIGWYQRGDWSAWSIQIGCMWQRSNEARWVQNHALVRRMAPF